MCVKQYLFDLATDKKKGILARAARAVLFPFSLLYGAGVAAVSSFRLSRRVALPCKVISVGNITLGGTGKTLLVEYIARFLLARDCVPAILTRGYKRPGSGRPGGTGYEAMGDEPFMLSRKLKVPVLVDPDRLRSGRIACGESRAGAVILDDGFQQWGIRKDLDIVCVDGLSAFGNLRLIPAGLLREPLSALARADVLFLTGASDNASGLKKFCSGLNPRALVVEAARQVSGFRRIGGTEGGEQSPSSMRGVKACLLSGIGNPASFRDTARAAGIEPALVFDFPDHHRYSAADIARVAAACEKRHITTVVTTEKDEPRLAGLLSAPVPWFFVLMVNLRITSNEQEFTDRLQRVLTA